MSRDPRALSLSSLLKLLSKPLIIKLIDALGRRKYTLAGLAKKTNRSKPQVCMYVGDLIRLGFVSKAMEGGKMRYWLEDKSLRGIYRKARQTLESHTAPGG
ncbi:MAG: hypothetical protein ACYTFG_01245 [Planctomycetota bacterium]